MVHNNLNIFLKNPSQTKLFFLLIAPYRHTYDDADGDPLPVWIYSEQVKNIQQRGCYEHTANRAIDSSDTSA